MARHQRQWILSDPHTAVHDAIAFLDRCAIRCRGYRFWLFLLRRRPLAQLDASKNAGLWGVDLIHFADAVAEAEMAGQPGFFDLSDRYEAL
ncbi:hypothetical protein, partial [Sphingobium yanoikuyae]